MLRKETLSSFTFGAENENEIKSNYNYTIPKINILQLIGYELELATVKHFLIETMYRITDFKHNMILNVLNICIILYVIDQSYPTVKIGFCTVYKI